ncbi:DUF2971 domain-containing protein [Microbulbifer sp. ANSA003]|uniref:DUF2971 domain-containing protein n=1 Tax=Microbulbifer sp. ANSA003 TaxID=3243360 RepID=UPI00404181FD
MLGRNNDEGKYEAGKMWLSNRQYMNDPTEGTDCKTLLNAFFEEKYKSVTCNDTHQAIKKFIYDSTNYFSVDESYIACFSEGDKLSQWRGYCSKEGGYCIGFEKKHIKELEIQKNLHVEKCKYIHEEKMKDWESIYNDACTFYDTHKTLHAYDTNQMGRSIYNQYLQMSYKILLNVLTHKDEGYKEETESRVVIYSKDTNYKIKFRPSKSYLIPYIEHQEICQHIKSIIIGPSPNAEFNRRSIERYLKEIKKTDIEVIDSVINFRA